jgi:2-C-methyl-D-erythritol 4-phosphate cytidylyltransferase
MPRHSALSTQHSALVGAVVVAAGSSSRMGGKVRKPYLRLRGKPILAWTLRGLTRVRGLTQIVVVTRPEDRALAAAIAKAARLPRRIALAFADGGARRQDSVHNGLKAVLRACEVVMIHDVARPFADPRTMERACAVARTVGGAILARRIQDTVKRERPGGCCSPSPLAGEGRVRGIEGDAAPRIIETIDRAGLWGAQTPQVFRRNLILELFERLAREAPEHNVTDDAAVCEFFGQPVALIESSDANLKITTREDLGIAEALLHAKAG